ncbi:MAG: RNA 2'-phosphotransferase [Deltaproteobacteria bacterium]|nr:RNA 2'-phosphotransferase [Deltaproteobacteria bacterium]
MDEAARIRTSKFLSRVLRHRPGSIGLELDANGWVDVDLLLARCQQHGRTITREDLFEVVALCDKQRFALSPDGERVRANQGHSVAVELGYVASTPPAVLYHGTAGSRTGSIRKEGLRRMRRHHVHLSADEQTALRVGSRHGRAVVLTVQAERMVAAGHAFYVSANGVWLTEHVPPEYLGWPGDQLQK